MLHDAVEMLNAESDSVCISQLFLVVDEEHDSSLLLLGLGFLFFWAVGATVVAAVLGFHAGLHPLKAFVAILTMPLLLLGPSFSIICKLSIGPYCLGWAQWFVSVMGSGRMRYRCGAGMLTG